jgi:colanic acid biosynthesis glycosyl transferase WcaI
MIAPKRSIAIVSSNFWPEQSGIGQVTTEFADYLAEAGIDVSVVTAMPYYPEWRIHDGYRGRLWRTEHRGRIAVHRAWHRASPAPGALSRIAHEVTLCLFSLPNMIRVIRRADVVYIVTPDLAHAFLATLVAASLKVRREVIVQDVMPDAAVELGMLTNRVVIRISRWMARRTYALADRILTLSEGMRFRIARETRHPEKIGLLPNTIDARELAPGPDQGKSFRRRFVPEGTFAVVHAGNMGQKQDLDLLLRTARRLREHPNIHFYVFGDGAVKDAFVRRVDEWRLENVSHHPFQDRQMLPHMLYGADVVLVSQLPEVVDIIVPSKLITAMGAGAMIVAACAADSETARLVQESRGGIVLPPSDDAALAAALLAISNGEVDSAGFRQKAHAFAVAGFDRRATYERVLGELSTGRSTLVGTERSADEGAR